MIKWSIEELEEHLAEVKLQLLECWYPLHLAEVSCQVAQEQLGLPNYITSSLRRLEREIRDTPMQWEHWIGKIEKAIQEKRPGGKNEEVEGMGDRSLF